MSNEKTLQAFQVDFNELMEEDLILFSKTDLRIDGEGDIQSIHEGMSVIIYEKDSDGNQSDEFLVAIGSTELNSGWLLKKYPYVKWNCRINIHGIKHQSSIRAKI